MSALRIAAAIALTLSWTHCVRASEIAPVSEQAEVFDGRIKPFFAQYCGDCHFGEAPAAGLPLDYFKTVESIESEHASWLKILESLRTRVMPPEDMDQPSDEERNEIVSWIDAQLKRVDCAAKRPGHVTIRRLNKTEYANTVRDLVGVDFNPAADFPSDDVGYGFDNIGDVLSTPPLLLEKYLAAAERIASAAILAPEDLTDETHVYTPNELKARHGNRRPDGAHGLNTNGAFVTFVHSFPRAATYTFRIRAYGEQAGDEPPRMKVKLEREVIAEIDVPGEEANGEYYEAKAAVEPGKHRLVVEFVNDYMDPEGPPRRRDRNLIVMAIEVIAPKPEWDQAELPAAHKQILFKTPTSDDDWESTAREVLAPFATKAFRRPVKEDELARLSALALRMKEDGASFERAMQTAVAAILVSPGFLFRAEPPKSEGISLLDDYQLASRLSYFLWSTMPDDELFELAAAGALRENLDAQVDRMLKHPKARALVDNFVMQWLHLRNLDRVAPDTTVFPQFDGMLRQSMLKETELFALAIIREDRSILEFLDGEFTYVNERLAKHYGIPGVKGDAFQRVSLNGLPRYGVLTQASVLTVTSNPTRTSPVKRGKWILEQLLGAPPPPPPPGVAELEPESKAAEGLTLRQQTELHRSDPNCAACHARMDPLGFGLENFDAIGVFRTEERGAAIDASGALPDGSTFNGPGELVQTLDAMRHDFVLSFVERLLTYALGRGVEPYDRCTVHAIADAMPGHNYRFSALVKEIVHSEPFVAQEGKRASP